MNIKKVVILLFLTVFLGLNKSAYATKLPSDVWDYVKANLPQAQQRFDSVIVISDNLMYIPLYPPSDINVDDIKIEYSYPDKTPLSKYPEVVLLNNGYSFLKVTRDKDGNYSLTKKDDLPIKVRLGLMPQDMLTPVGLKMPESLKLTLGDLLIPSKEESSLVLKEGEKEKVRNSYTNAVFKNEFISAQELKNKRTLINPRNSKFIEVYDNTSQNPLYELKLSSMPLKIITSEKSNAALVLYWSGREVEIINLADENTIAKIQIDANASDVVLNKKDNIAYITSQNANTIYLVDLNSMKLTKAIKLDQRPSKIAYCEEDDTIAFFDEFASKIYKMKQQSSQYTVEVLGSAMNISKLLCDETNVYAISRTQNELYVFDKASLKLTNTIETDKKPTDVIRYNNKLFILCSKEGYLDVYDIEEAKLISREQLSKDGFYSKMTFIPNDNNILITGINSKSYLIYNLDTMKLVKKQDSYIDVANIIILNKTQRL